MATRKQPAGLIQGTSTHTRSQDSYMMALLDEVDLDDWRGIVRSAVTAAKDGDAQARAWLGAYLVGRPESKAPTAVQVVVNQLAGVDPVINRLADKLTAPSFGFDDTGHRAQVTRQIKSELAVLRAPENTHKPNMDAG